MSRLFCSLRLFSILCLFFIAGSACASVYRVGQHDAAFQYGFGYKENFDIALHIDDQGLVGAKIVGVRFPVVANLHITDDGYTAWLSTELTVKSNVNIPNGPKVAAQVNGNYAEARFEQPYTIGEGGVYVGYSFSMDAIEDDNDRNPVLLVPSNGVGSNNLWLRASRAYRTWRDFGALANANAAIEVILDDASRPTYAAGLVGIDRPLRLAIDNAKTLPLTITNHGTASISDVAYEMQLGDQRINGEYHFDAPVSGDVFGSTANIEIPLPATEIWNKYDCAVSITKVNGQENAGVAPSRSFALHVLPFVPVHRPLFEEYTGLWCGWCPSGYVGLKLLAEHHGSDCVIASIHFNDAMQVMTAAQYAYSIEGYPTMYVDRKATTDPLFGDNLNYLYGLDIVWRKHYEQETDCDIEITSAYDETLTHVNATANIRFLTDVAKADYRVAFYLTADDLNNPQWAQTNYYAGDRNMPDEMSDFTKGEPAVKGLHFDDVLVDFDNAKGVAGTLPSTIKAGETYSVSHSFDLSKNKLVKKGTPLHAIAFVVDNATGQVLNANHVAPTGGNDAIQSITPDAVLTSEVYYDLQGRRIKSHVSGAAIRVCEYSDGSRRSFRVVR